MEHKTYTKINTLYKRYDSGKNKGIIKVGDYSNPEIEYLKDLKWLCFEKIDGTNIGIYWDGKTKEYHGKSDKADIPSGLISVLDKIIDIEGLANTFTPKEDKPLEVRIYGEGFGGNIQGKMGKGYGDFDFIVFDISIGGMYLDYEVAKEIVERLGLKMVPLVGVMTLSEAEEYVKNGFKSFISQDKNLDAEGLVCRPLMRLFNNKGERIITKIKTCDYRKLANLKN